MLDEEQEANAQPLEWKKGQVLLSLCQQMEYEDAEKMLKYGRVDLEEEDDGVKADPNASYPDGTTGLHMAALNNSVEWAQLLLRYGADKDRKNDDGETALDCAIDADAEEVIALLRAT